MKYIKSPLNYTGGKYKLLNDILPMFPSEIDIFVDLFVGGLNVGINVEAEKIICNDHNSYLIDLYLRLKENDMDTTLNYIYSRIDEFGLSKTNSTGYNLLRDEYNRTKNVLDLFVLTCFSFNHQIRFNNSHKFNTPFGKDRSSYNSRIENNLIKFIEQLKHKDIEFYNNDFTEIDLNNLTDRSLVYCDPPYLISNASYNDGNRGFKNWTETEEKELLDLLDHLNDRNIKFALSNVFYHKGLENNLLIEWSKKYNVKYIDNNYSNCSYQFNKKDSKTVEVLITNYDDINIDSNISEQLKML